MEICKKMKIKHETLGEIWITRHTHKCRIKHDQTWQLGQDIKSELRPKAKDETYGFRNVKVILPPGRGGRILS